MPKPDAEGTGRDKIKNSAFRASRAAEVVGWAEATLDPDKRLSLLRTAENYTRIAQRIEKRVERPR
jgi:hypothetical protein